MKPSGAPGDWRDSWTEIGQSSNTVYYADGRLLIAWPNEGAVDTKETAEENVRYQQAYFAKLGQPGVVVIFFDRMLQQDKGSRTVYSTATSPDWALGIALIGGTLMSRALGSFFLGLSRASQPLAMFASFTAAKGWIESLIGELP